MNWSVSLSSKLAALLMMAGAAALLGAAPPPPADKAKVEPAVKLPAAFAKEVPEGVEDLKAIQDHVKKVLKKVMPAVVGIRMGQGAGSGVVISADGYVLTAGHVSGKPGQECTLLFPDGKKAKGKSLGWNRRMDSGLIQITDKGKWPHVAMGESSKLKEGQWTVAIGHPGGFKPGRSPVVRVGRIVRFTKALIQTDNTLVGGDSGGPLFDMEGKVIGIHSRIGRNIIENVHVPVNSYRDDWDRLVKAEVWGGGMFGFGRRPAARAYLGVVFDTGTDDLKVVEVTKDSPAEKAGIKEGDVILSIDGTKLKDRTALGEFMDKKSVGDEVTVEIQREDEVVKLKIKLGRRPPPRE
jgi:serine protease Do